MTLADVDEWVRRIAGLVAIVGFTTIVGAVVFCWYFVKRLWVNLLWPISVQSGSIPAWAQMPGGVQWEPLKNPAANVGRLPHIEDNKMNHRKCAIKITFAEPFVERPVVTVSLYEINTTSPLITRPLDFPVAGPDNTHVSECKDTLCSQCLINLTVKNCTEKGCEVEVVTWDHGYVESVGISWVAVGRLPFRPAKQAA